MAMTVPVKNLRNESSGTAPWQSRLTSVEISGRLADTAFSEAAGVLETIAQSPHEREMYEARLKFERDQVWRLRAAENKGMAKGIERGEFFGQIRLLESQLALPQSSSSELSAMEIEHLRNVLAQLQAKVHDRR